METGFDYRENYILENNKVALIPLTPNNFDPLYQFVNEKELWRYYPIIINNRQTLGTFFSDALTGKAAGSDYPFIVWDKIKKEWAGSTRFYDIVLSQQRVQIGFTWFGSKFQGSGVNKNCKFLMLQFAFETMQVERVEFRADVRNERSIAAMKSIGCSEEGILRNYMPLPDGTRRNTLVLSILRQEWFDGIKEMLTMKLSKDYQQK